MFPRQPHQVVASKRAVPDRLQAEFEVTPLAGMSEIRSGMNFAASLFLVVLDATVRFPFCMPLKSHSPTLLPNCHRFQIALSVQECTSRSGHSSNPA
jgi:hypothetical protein